MIKAVTLIVSLNRNQINTEYGMVSDLLSDIAYCLGTLDLFDIGHKMKKRERG